MSHEYSELQFLPNSNTFLWSNRVLHSARPTSYPSGLGRHLQVRRWGQPLPWVQPPLLPLPRPSLAPHPHRCWANICSAQRPSMGLPQHLPLNRDQPGHISPPSNRATRKTHSRMHCLQENFLVIVQLPPITTPTEFLSKHTPLHTPQARTATIWSTDGGKTSLGSNFHPCHSPVLPSRYIRSTVWQAFVQPHAQACTYSNTSISTWISRDTSVLLQTWSENAIGCCG